VRDGGIDERHAQAVARGIQDQPPAERVPGVGIDAGKTLEADGRQKGGPVGKIEAVAVAVAMQQRGARESAFGARGRAAYRNDALARQSLRTDVGRAVEGAPFDDDVDAGRDGVLLAEPVGDDDVDLGGPPVEAFEARDQPVRREERRDRDLQPLAARVPARAHNRPGDHLEGGLEVVSQALAVGGQAHAAAVPLQDGDAQVALELLDVAADRAGRYREFVTGVRDRTQPRDRFERTQSIQGRQPCHTFPHGKHVRELAVA